MRHTALFDGAGRQPRILWLAGGGARPPRRAAPYKAGLVPLGAPVVDGHHRWRALRAPSVASNKIAAVKSPSAARAGFSPISSARAVCGRYPLLIGTVIPAAAKRRAGI